MAVFGSASAIAEISDTTAVVIFEWAASLAAAAFEMNETHVTRSTLPHSTQIVFALIKRGSGNLRTSGRNEDMTTPAPRRILGYEFIGTLLLAEVWNSFFLRNKRTSLQVKTVPIAKRSQKENTGHITA